MPLPSPLLRGGQQGTCHETNTISIGAGCLCMPASLPQGKRPSASKEGLSSLLALGVCYGFPGCRGSMPGWISMPGPSTLRMELYVHSLALPERSDRKKHINFFASPPKTPHFSGKCKVLIFLLRSKFSAGTNEFAPFRCKSIRTGGGGGAVQNHWVHAQGVVWQHSVLGRPSGKGSGEGFSEGVLRRGFPEIAWNAP